jgi:UDP-N-acetylglucosamine transferase subunit ALG13
MSYQEQQPPEMRRDLIFVTVGTDHHPFDRLCAWFDEWVAAGKNRSTECLVQSGTSKPPVVAPASDYVRYDEMVSAMERSVAVVCHGGPATIMDARRYGRVPIVLPRSADLGEHVDNHQQRFAKKMAELGQIHLVTTKEELFDLLERAVADPDAFALEHCGDEIAAAVKRFEQLVDGLFVK